MLRRTTPLSALLLLGVVACGAAQPPPELVDARKAYERASKGLATQLAPAQLDTAKQALDKAEKSFEDEGVDAPTPDLAYVAERKAELAEATAGKVAAERDAKQADKKFKDTQLEGLDKAKSELSKERQAGEKTKAQLEQERKELEQERVARAEAERKAAAAMASLQEIAKVKEESRGMVITLSGSVLFATGKYELLPIARDKLDEVAKALTDQGYKSIVIEGHTDSRGKAADNETLSLKRAESVRTYLVSRGIPSDKITASGLGSSRPVADNGTPDGRANNRRVEIVVQPLK
ncbi:MAG TPA: OmpA family protein [Polyangiaceae bacterium]|nr:OmpA family protein [Polyangiaceae bacterium]